MIRTDTIEITGEAELLDAGYYAIAKLHGWTEKIFNGSEEIDNPVTAKDHALYVTRKFWRDTISTYNSNQAQEQARRMAEEQSKTALDTLIVTLKDN